MTPDMEKVLSDLFQWCILEGNKSGRSKRPEVRDAFHRVAAKIAHEMLALGLPQPEEPRGH